jgi:hypothetical protein
VPGQVAASDFDPAMGGASPLLGFASGGAFLGYQARLTDRLDLTATILQPHLGPLKLSPTTLAQVR